MDNKVTKDPKIDLSSEYGNAIRARLNSPFIGSYVIFVLLWNWESVLLLVLSGQETAVVISDIKQGADYLSLLVYPLISSVFYLLTYPLVAGLFNTWRSFANSLVYKLSSAITAREDAAMFERVKRLEHGDLTEELLVLNEASRELNAEVDTLREEIRKKSAHLIQLTKDHEALRADEHSTLRQIEDARNDNAKNDRTLKTIESDARKRSEAIETQQLELERILKNNSNLTQRLNEAKDQMNLKSKEYESIEHEVVVTTEAAKSLKGELEKLKLEKSKLEKSTLEESKPEKSKPEKSKPEKSKPEKSKLEEPEPEKSKSEKSNPAKLKLEKSKPETLNQEKSKPGKSKPGKSKQVNAKHEKSTLDISNAEQDVSKKEVAKSESREITVPLVPDDPKFNELLGEDLGESSLEKYSGFVYPEEGWDAELASILLARINLQAYKTVEKIHWVVMRYSAAVGIFAQKHDLFRTGTDSIVHSLGFHDHQIRAKMDFSKPSLAAFQEHEELTLVLGLFEENVSAPEYKAIVLLRSEKVESVEIAEMIKKFRADSVDDSGKAMRHFKLELDKMHVSLSIINEVGSLLAAS